MNIQLIKTLHRLLKIAQWPHVGLVDIRYGCDFHIQPVYQIWSLCDHRLQRCIRQRKM